MQSTKLNLSGVSRVLFIAIIVVSTWIAPKGNNWFYDILGDPRIFSFIILIFSISFIIIISVDIFFQTLINPQKKWCYPSINARVFKIDHPIQFEWTTCITGLFASIGMMISSIWYGWEVFTGSLALILVSLIGLAIIKGTIFIFSDRFGNE